MNYTWNNIEMASGHHALEHSWTKVYNLFCYAVSFSLYDSSHVQSINVKREDIHFFFSPLLSSFCVGISHTSSVNMFYISTIFYLRRKQRKQYNSCALWHIDCQFLANFFISWPFRECGLIKKRHVVYLGICSTFRISFVLSRTLLTCDKNITLYHRMN